VFPVRYDTNFYILIRRNLVFKGVIEDFVWQSYFQLYVFKILLTHQISKPCLVKQIFFRPYTFE
jgi:hypothetical protein